MAKKDVRCHTHNSRSSDGAFSKTMKMAAASSPERNLAFSSSVARFGDSYCHNVSPFSPVFKKTDRGPVDGLAFSAPAFGIVASSFRKTEKRQKRERIKGVL